MGDNATPESDFIGKIEPRKRKRCGHISAMLIWLSGHSIELAFKTPPAERNRLAALGACLILPIGISGFGAFATVYQAFGRPSAACVVAIIVAGFTLVVDRALLAATSKGVVSVGLRFCLTLLSSTIFAHTALLWLFSDAIDAQAAQSRREEIVAISSQFKPERNSAKIDTIKGQIEAATQLLRRSDISIDETTKELTSYRAKYSDEVEGRGPSGKPGEGQEARRLMTVRIQPLESELARHQADQLALREELRLLRADLRKAIETKAGDPAVARFNWLLDEAAHRSDNGVLSRFMMLHELIRADRAALTAYVLICLFLLLWELVPVLLKFTMPEGEYARLARLAEIESEAAAKAMNETMEKRAALRERHRFHLELMEVEELEGTRWLSLAEERFRKVQEQRGTIPKRATDEQREAYLSALTVAMASLESAGNRLQEG